MPKAQKKKQQKVIQDRTFGLKNKNKSKTVQKFIKGVENTVKNQGKSAAILETQQFERKKNKKKQEQEKALLNALYRDVGRLNEDSEEEEDPKNIVCPYFKQGLCQKGKKCMYSHDLTLDRNQEIDLYVDQRTQLIMNKIGTNILNNMSEEQVNVLIAEKEKEYFKGQKSDIVCKNFLEAVEKNKYGWNWTCQNGDRCKYKHCLPPGYVLNKDGGKVKVEDEGNIEEKIDEQRNKFLNENKGSPLVTLQVFLKWKEDKILRRAKEAEKKKKDEEKKNKNKVNLRTGKQLFTYDPTLFVDDAQAADKYEQEEVIVEEEGEEQQKLKQEGEGEEEGEEEKVEDEKVEETEDN